MLVVAVGLLDRDFHDVKDVRGLLEDVVHLLKRTETGLGEEEVHGGEDECVSGTRSQLKRPGRLVRIDVGNLHNSEDDVGLVFYVFECHGGDHHDHEVEDPVGTW